MVKILQVASFKGNVGDIANHFGFRAWFERFFQEKTDWQEFEIRTVFRGEASFNESFVEFANEFDLVVIGGGNFFELWVDRSPTGTSISIEEKYLDKIIPPIFVNAVGVDDGMGVTTETLAKFNAFLERLVTLKKGLVSVRNDGAYHTLSKYVSDASLLEYVVRLPDGGFFADIPHAESIYDGPVIGINLAGDMPDIRFGQTHGEHSYREFLEEYACFLKTLSEKNPNLSFVFFPHIYTDLKIVSDLFELLPDKIRREYCRVEMYDSNISFQNSVFKSYNKCSLILGMRFHANVLAIANEIPVIGLYCYKQIKSLYEELDLAEYCVDVRRKGYSKKLIELCEHLLRQQESVKHQLRLVNEELIKSRALAADKILQWLRKHNFKLN
jgi:polysaccharide pyruvyl transferase WcaK-like protein